MTETDIGGVCCNGSGLHKSGIMCRSWPLAHPSVSKYVQAGRVHWAVAAPLCAMRQGHLHVLTRHTSLKACRASRAAAYIRHKLRLVENLSPKCEADRSTYREQFLHSKIPASEGCAWQVWKQYMPIAHPCEGYEENLTNRPNGMDIGSTCLPQRS